MDSSFGVCKGIERRWLGWFLLSVLLWPAIASAQSAEEQYAQAMELYRAAKYEAAAGQFETLTREQPALELAFFFLGESLVQQGLYEKASTAFESFVDRAPDHAFHARAVFRLGESAFHRKQKAAAVRWLEAFSTEYPEDPLNEIALPYLAELRLNNGEFQLAVLVFQRVLKEYPAGQLADKCRFGLARALQAQGEANQAAEVYQQLMTSSDQDLARRASYQLGMIAWKNQEWREARERLTRFRELSEPEPPLEIDYWIARTWLAENNKRKALEFYQQFLAGAKQQPQSETLTKAAFREALECARESENWELANQLAGQFAGQFPQDSAAVEATAAQLEILFQENQTQPFRKLARVFLAAHPKHAKAARLYEMLGRLAYADGEFAEAAANFRLAIDLADDSAAVPVATRRYLLGLALVGNEQLEDALQELDAIQTDGLAAELAADIDICRGSTLVAVGRLEEAVPAFEKHLATSTNEQSKTRARWELFQVQVELERWEAAAAQLGQLAWDDAARVESVVAKAADAAYRAGAFEQALPFYHYLEAKGATDRARVNGLAGIAWCQREQHGPGAGQAWFERISQEYPGSSQAAEALMAQAMFLKATEPGKAAAHLKALASRFPESPLAGQAALECARLRQQLGGGEQLRNAREVLTDYLQNASSNEQVDEILFQLALIYRDLNQLRHSEERLKQIVEDHPDSPVWAEAAYRLALHQVQTGDIENAEPLIERMIARNVSPQLVTRALFLRGQVAFQSGDWNRLAALLKQLEGLQADESLLRQSRYWYAEAVHHSTKPARALPEWERLAADQQAVAEQWQPWVALRHAESLGAVDRWQAALVVIEQGIADFPEFEALGDLYFLQGRGLCREGQFTAATQAFENVIEAAPGSEAAAKAQWRLGEICFHQERYADAIRAFEKVVTDYQFPAWSAAAMMQAAKCQEKLGNWQQAVRLYHNLAEQYPNSEFVAEAKQRLAVATRRAERRAQDAISR